MSAEDTPASPDARIAGGVTADGQPVVLLAFAHGPEIVISPSGASRLGWSLIESAQAARHMAREDA